MDAASAGRRRVDGDLALAPGGAGVPHRAAARRAAGRLHCRTEIRRSGDQPAL